MIERTPSTLSIKSLSVTAGGREILRPDSLSFELSPGEIVGLLGPNGSGKSTLLRTICGLVKKNGGAVNYGEKDTDTMKPKELARTFGYVAQSEKFTSAYTVIESVLMGRYPHMSRFQDYGKEDYRIAHDSLCRVGLEHFDGRIVTELSGGEASRVVIARVLAQQTPVLLLDEPTAALDPKHSMTIMSLLRKLASEERSILIALHDINLALGGVDRVIFLKDGAIVDDRSASSVDEDILEQVYDLPWEIVHREESERTVAIPISS